MKSLVISRQADWHSVVWFIGCFLVSRALLFVSFCVVVWVLFSVFSIFCITSLVSATPRNHRFIHELHCFLLFITSVLNRIIIIIASFRSPYFVNISVTKHGPHNWLLLIRMRVNMASCQQNPISDQTKTCYANKNTWEVVSWIFHSLTSIRRTLLRYCQVAAWWRFALK